eukprot:10255057-Alexandrium_andersonii.AAC.1
MEGPPYSPKPGSIGTASPARPLGRRSGHGRSVHVSRTRSDHAPPRPRARGGREECNSSRKRSRAGAIPSAVSPEILRRARRLGKVKSERCRTQPATRSGWRKAGETTRWRPTQYEQPQPPSPKHPPQPVGERRDKRPPTARTGPRKQACGCAAQPRATH